MNIQESYDVEIKRGRIAPLEIILPDRMTVALNFIGTDNTIILVIGDTPEDDPTDDDRHIQSDPNGTVLIQSDKITPFPEDSQKYLTAIEFRGGNPVPVAQGLLFKPIFNSSSRVPDVGVGSMTIGDDFIVE